MLAIVLIATHFACNRFDCNWFCLQLFWSLIFDAWPWYPMWALYYFRINAWSQLNKRYFCLQSMTSKGDRWDKKLICRSMLDPSVVKTFTNILYWDINFFSKTSEVLTSARFLSFSNLCCLLILPSVSPHPFFPFRLLPFHHQVPNVFPSSCSLTPPTLVCRVH